MLKQWIQYYQNYNKILKLQAREFIIEYLYLKIMGCPYSKQKGHANQIDHSQFINLAKKLSKQLQIEKNRFKANQAQTLQRFKKEVRKEVKKRENYLEQQMMEDIVYFKDMQEMYSQIMLQCKKIIDNQHLLSLLLKKKKNLQSQNGRKAIIMTPIQIILFSSDILTVGSIAQKANDLQKMADLVNTRYSEVKAIQKSPNQLINHYKTFRRPNSKMIRQWVMTLCSTSQDISLSIVNKAGHNISY